MTLLDSLVLSHFRLRLVEACRKVIILRDQDVPRGFIRCAKVLGRHPLVLRVISRGALVQQSSLNQMSVAQALKLILAVVLVRVGEGKLP